MPIFVDSNVILDLVTQDPVWLTWSSRALQDNAPHGLLANAMIYAELCCNGGSSGEADGLLAEMDVQLAEIPRKALFAAAKAHVAYRKQGGTRTTGLPDFFIGAQALGVAILTRDPGRYKTYFPGVPLICP
jgi:predicted nucleic acid-binding protein